MFVEEEHACAKGGDVERMEACRGLLEMLEEVSCFHLVEECGTILEFVDVTKLVQPTFNV